MALDVNQLQAPPSETPSLEGDRRKIQGKLDSDEEVLRSVGAPRRPYPLCGAYGQKRSGEPWEEGVFLAEGSIQAKPQHCESGVFLGPPLPVVWRGWG